MGDRRYQIKVAQIVVGARHASPCPPTAQLPFTSPKPTVGAPLAAPSFPTTQLRMGKPPCLPIRIKLRNSRQSIGAITPVGAGPRCLPCPQTPALVVHAEGR